jgi:endonuclease/exonuclease/phosphatase (EEP) superfamily protein YafD
MADRDDHRRSRRHQGAPPADDDLVPGLLAVPPRPDTFDADRFLADPASPPAAQHPSQHTANHSAGQGVDEVTGADVPNAAPPAPGSRRARRLAEAAGGRTAAPAEPDQRPSAEPDHRDASPNRTEPSQPYPAQIQPSPPYPSQPYPSQPYPELARPTADPSVPSGFSADPSAPASLSADPSVPSGLSADRSADREPDDPFAGPFPAAAPATGDRGPAAASGGPLLPLVALALLGWAATGLIGPDRPRTLVGALAWVASVSPLASVAAVAVIALALRGRRWVSCGIAVVAGLAPWTFAVPYALPATPPSGSVTAVRVLVVNAHEGDADPKDISAAVRKQSVDLLVITELTSRLAHDLTVSGLDGPLVARWVDVPSAATGAAAQAGLGVWSRLPMTDLAPVPGMHWPAVRATLDTGHGRLTVIAGHVVPPSPTSAGSWSTDLAALHAAGQASGPVTVLGGLNGTPWNAQFRAAASGGLRDAGDVLGRGIRPTWPTWLGLPLLPLDHALVGGRVGVRSLSGVSIDGTDHRALLVDLLVPDRKA